MSWRAAAIDTLDECDMSTIQSLLLIIGVDITGKDLELEFSRQSARDTNESLTVFATLAALTTALTTALTSLATQCTTGSSTLTRLATLAPFTLTLAGFLGTLAGFLGTLASLSGLLAFLALLGLLRLLTTTTTLLSCGLAVAETPVNVNDVRAVWFIEDVPGESYFDFGFGVEFSIVGRLLAQTLALGTGRQEHVGLHGLG